MIDDTHAHTHSSPAMTVLNFVGSMLWGHLDDYDFDDVNDEAVSNPNTNNDSNDGTNDGAQTNISTTDVNVQLTTHPADGVYSDTEADHYQHMDENDVANVDAKNDEEIKTNDSENGKEDADSGGGGCFGGLFSHARTKSAVERQMTLSAQTTLKRVKTIRSNERVSAEQVVLLLLV